MYTRIGIMAGAMLAVAGWTAQASAATNVKVTIETPGQQTTTTALQYGGVETFDGLVDTGVQNFTSNFSTSPSPVVSGTYTGVNIKAADQYGGAGGVNQYAVAGLSNVPSSYSISFTGEPINYFGYWLSALDSGNSVTFYKGGEALFSFNPSDVLAFVGPSGSNYLDGAYYGNPNGTNQNMGEPYVFVNFYLEDEGATFDEIVFQQTAANPGAGYESDNHTVGWYADQTGTEVPAVPEPATWGLMILGFGLIGASFRRRGKVAVTFG